jgi:hypothetical protein
MAKRTSRSTGRKPGRPTKPAPTRRQPRTGSLPGLEDHAIKPLDHLAADYADIRDQRMDLTRQEVDLKARTLKLMKKYGKTKYQHNGILIEIEPGEETIKVRVKKVDELPEDVDPDAPDSAPADEGTEEIDGETLADA